jgi:AcrR family transcriptional regulator
MNDVAAVAGVSRGTLYRYFASKTELLESLVEYERQRFQQGVNELLASLPPGQVRLEAHIRFIFGYLREHPALANLIETEPRYLLAFLSSHLESFRQATGVLLEPILRDAPVVRRADVSFDAMSDIVFRLLLSFFLFPPQADDEAASLEAVSVVVRELAAPRPAAGRT